MNEEIMIRPVVDTRDERIESLEDDVRRLRAELAAAKREASDARADAGRALSALRKQLNPLYLALQAVFGELDAAGLDDVSSGGSMQSSAYWDDWKRRLGGSCAKVIDALLLGGEMSVKSITIAARMGQQTVYEATSKMGRAGILIRNGKKFSLKSPQ
jgi:hypothetical protein